MELFKILSFHPSKMITMTQVHLLVFPWTLPRLQTFRPNEHLLKMSKSLVIWRNYHRWENQATCLSVEWPNIPLSLFHTFLEQQSKAIEDKACLHQSQSLCTERWKVQKYLLLLEYLKLIVNCSCVQKQNTKQKATIHLIDPRTLQNKAAKTTFWILESKSVSMASIENSVFVEIENVKCWYIFYIL